MPTAPEPAQNQADSRPPENYLDLYGLSKPPFGGGPDNAGYILFGSHRRAFELLIDHIVNGSGVMLLHGEEGIGKTETLRSAAGVAAESGLRTIMISRPPNGRVELTQLVSALEDRPTAGGITTDGAIGKFLAPPRKALLADDIDLMPEDCVRMLASLTQRMPKDPGGPAIVLSSSTDLTGGATRPDLSPLVTRARNSIRMSQLGPAEVRQYIERSLWIAGGTTRRLITADAMKLLIARSGGVPGNINRLMEAAFTAGFARGDTMITAKTVAAAMGPTASRPRPRPRPSHQPSESSGMAGAAMQIIAIGLLLTGASAFLYKGLNSPPNYQSPTAPEATVRQRPATQPLAAPPPEAPVIETRPEAPMVETRPQQLPGATPAQSLSPELMAALMKRGNRSLELGDIEAARLLFQRAAEAGNAVAAMALGKTYDPNYTAPGETPDPERAAEWYQRSVTLGDAHATALLKQLGGHKRR